MAVFDKLDWMRLDVHAIVACHGVATVYAKDRDFRAAWLTREGYTIVPFDFSDGSDNSTPRLGRLFRWEENFGYTMRLPRPGLDALNDGFDFDVPLEGGLVFYISGGDVAFTEDSRWFSGLLSIASEYSLHKLAMGRRFFTLVEVNEKSPLIGADVRKLTLPWPLRSPKEESDYAARLKALDDLTAQAQELDMGY